MKVSTTLGSKEGADLSSTKDSDDLNIDEAPSPNAKLLRLETMYGEQFHKNICADTDAETVQ